MIETEIIESNTQRARAYAHVFKPRLKACQKIQMSLMALMRHRFSFSNSQYRFRGIIQLSRGDSPAIAAMIRDAR
jgi:hypothetical protein